MNESIATTAPISSDPSSSDPGTTGPDLHPEATLGTLSQAAWSEILAPFMRGDYRRAILQLINTAIPFAALWYLMLRSTEVSFWLTLGLGIPAAFFLIRLFIFQHDCGHGSFFPSRRANTIVGTVLGVVSLTPYEYWRRTHAIHHATSGNLDRRELGDIDTLTVREYLQLSRWRRLLYRLYRNPIVLLVIGPFYQFVIKHRFPLDAPLSWKREWRSVMLTNLALLAVVVWAWKTIGVGRLLMVQLPITLISGAIGVWLFYVQHQFEDTYWEDRETWSFDNAGLEGSSFYDLPRFLHWLTGNIGYHHIHHLSSRIPNYRLRQCLEAIPELWPRKRLTLLKSFHCIRLKLWDEESNRLVGFRHLRSLRAG